MKPKILKEIHRDHHKMFEEVARRAEREIGKEYVYKRLYVQYNSLIYDIIGNLKRKVWY